MFRYLQAELVPHSIERLASMENARLPDSTPSGAIPSARTSTVCTYRTPRGNARPTTAIPHGPLCPPSVQSCTNREQQPRSSRPTGRGSTTTQHGHRDHSLPRLTRPILLRTARLARGGRKTGMERRGFSTATPAWLHTRRGAIWRTLRGFSLGVSDLRSVIFHPPVHPRPARHKLREPNAHAPWTSSMTTQLRKLQGTDQIGTTALNMLRIVLAPTTYANYDSSMRQFAAFCHEEDIHPLRATTHSIVRYTAWLGLQGTVAAASLQKYYSAINKLFRDHQQ
jgi:hypothetical protein